MHKLIRLGAGTMLLAGCNSGADNEHVPAKSTRANVALIKPSAPVGNTVTASFKNPVAAAAAAPADHCFRRWAYFPRDKSAGGDAFMLSLNRDSGKFEYQSGDLADDSVLTGDYASNAHPDDYDGPQDDSQSMTLYGDTEAKIWGCSAGSATVRLNFPQGDPQVVTVKPLTDDFLKKLERLGYDRAPD